MCMRMSCERMSMKSHFLTLCAFTSPLTGDCQCRQSWQAPHETKKTNVDEFSCASVSRQMSQHGHVYVLVTNRQWFNGSSWRCECDGMWAGWTNLRIGELSEMEIMFFCGSIVRQTKRCEIYWANAIGVNVCQINIDTKTMLHSRRWWTSSERTLNLCEERNA